MTSTARDFITLAMKEAGVLGVGQTLLSEDVNDGFTLLQRMLSQWQKRRWIVPMLIDVSNVGNNLKSNKIGPGQYYNSPRPDKIQSAYFIQLNTGATPVSMPLAPIFSHEDYDLVRLKDLNTWPSRFFYDGAFPYGNVYIVPIPSAIYEIHLTVKGAIGFDTEINAGVITAGGTGYVSAVYLAVPLTNINGTGSGATANITVSGGIVTIVTINDPGTGYVINDFVSASNANLGGAGSGFIYKITNVVGDVDSVFNMPPEYEEAIHYNLAVRLCSMYQAPASAEQIALAKIGMATIRAANTQIPSLRMPSAVRQGQGVGFNLFDPDGYGLG